jgi:hypothetical protein
MRKLGLGLCVALLGLARAALPQDASPTPPALTGPATGDVIPSFDAPGLALTPYHVSFPKGSKTVLIFFQASCPHCQRMIPVWNHAFERKPAGLTVMGVVMDDPPPGFLEALHIGFPVLHSPGRPFLRDIKVSSVPVTVRVGEGGKVMDVILGETNGLRVGELFAQ